MNKMYKQEPISEGAISDNEVVARVLNGERNLYSIIVRRHNQRLYRVGMSILRDDNETEDAMQVTYIKAYENLGKFNFQSAFSTWLIRILINECLQRLKRSKRSVRLDGEFNNGEVLDQYTTETQTPYMKVLNAELKAILEKAIYELPEKYRLVFVMREIENMNISETKECLDISEANVKVRLNRAKGLLKDSLSAYYRNDDILHFHRSRCDRMVEQVIQKIQVC